MIMSLCLSICIYISRKGIAEFVRKFMCCSALGNQRGESGRVSKGRVFSLQDEPEVARVWLQNNDSPGLAIPRAFGDFCLKDFGMTSGFLTKDLPLIFTGLGRADQRGSRRHCCIYSHSVTCSTLRSWGSSAILEDQISDLQSRRLCWSLPFP